MRETWVRLFDSLLNGAAEGNCVVVHKRPQPTRQNIHFDVEKLIACVNYPTAEYSYLLFHDFVCLNIDLEAQDGLESRLPRLHHLAGDQPLVVDQPIAAPRETSWPRISVVVCSHNGSRTIRDTLDGLLQLDYPAYEVIVVDDGSTDATASIVALCQL